VATGKITVAKLNDLDGWLWDEKVCGFGVRKQRRGLFYYVRVRHNGSQVMRSIGRHGAPWTPDTARAKALELLGTIASGADPFAQSQSLTGETFGTEIERYLLRRKGSLRPTSVNAIERHLRQYTAPLHKLPLDEIDRRTIAVLLGQVETDCGAVTRNRLRSSLSAFWAWAIAEGLAEQSPVTGTVKADEGGSRERVLSAEELKKLWHALGGNRFSEIVRLLLLTAARRNEIGNLTWDEIDLKRKLIVLAPDRTKNGRGLELPLSAQALAVINRVPRRNSSSFLFSDANGYKGWDQDKMRVDARLGIAPWRLHDLRRTCATQLGELGVAPWYIEAILNHYSKSAALGLPGHRSGVAGTYNRARYSDEMRTALQRWADHLDKITA
jgi:integrase